MTNRITTPPEARTVIVGVDTHKHVHVAVAIDSWGIRLGDHAFVADSGGYEALVTWASPPCCDGRPTFQRRMGSMHVVEVLEGFQLVFEVRRGPEQHPIHTLSPQGANQPLDKRMGHGDIRHTLDRAHPLPVAAST